MEKIILTNIFHLPAQKRDVAMYFFPSPTYASALRKMNRWLESDPNLLHDLEAAGYYLGQRNFNRGEIEVLFYYFGG